MGTSGTIVAYPRPHHKPLKLVNKLIKLSRPTKRDSFEVRAAGWLMNVLGLSA
jgi:hypothetical protein